MGKIHAAQYRVVVVDSRKKRDGRVIEEVGYYDPQPDPSVIRIDSERAQYWLGVGAQPSDQVRNLLVLTGDIAKHNGKADAVSRVIVSEADKAAQIKAKADEKAAQAAAKAQAQAEARAARTTAAPPRRSTRETPIEALTKSVLRTAGSTLTRELMRGILGGLKKR